MAKIREEFVLIRLSKLTKSADKTTKIIDDSLYTTLEEVVSGLVDENVIVEVEEWSDSEPDDPA